MDVYEDPVNYSERLADPNGINFTHWAFSDSMGKGELKFKTKLRFTELFVKILAKFRGAGEWGNWKAAIYILFIRSRPFRALLLLPRDFHTSNSVDISHVDVDGCLLWEFNFFVSFLHFLFSTNWLQTQMVWAYQPAVVMLFFSSQPTLFFCFGLSLTISFATYVTSSSPSFPGLFASFERRRQK